MSMPKWLSPRGCRTDRYKLCRTVHCGRIRWAFDVGREILPGGVKDANFYFAFGVFMFNEIESVAPWRPPASVISSRGGWRWLFVDGGVDAGDVARQQLADGRRGCPGLSAEASGTRSSIQMARAFWGLGSARKASMGVRLEWAWLVASITRSSNGGNREGEAGSTAPSISARLLVIRITAYLGKKTASAS